MCEGARRPGAPPPVWELRHSFVSIVSDNGVTIEQIADLVGHRTTIVTQKVYRHQLKSVISSGATAI